jgi:hypothetical protein
MPLGQPSLEYASGMREIIEMTKKLKIKHRLAGDAAVLSPVIEYSCSRVGLSHP